jgi:phage gp29-like protein
MKNPFPHLFAATRQVFTPTSRRLAPSARGPVLAARHELPNISATAKAADIQGAIREAESGDTQALFRFYRDVLIGDDLIQGELNKRKLAVIGQPTTVLPADKDSLDDVIAAAACGRAVGDCENWNAGLGSLLGSCLWPVAVAENIFRAADPEPVFYQAPNGHPSNATEEGALPSSASFTLRYTLKRFEPVNPFLFCFQFAYLRDAGAGAVDLADWEPYLRLWPLDDAGRILNDAAQAAKLDPARHVVHRGHLLTDQRDNWGGPMRAILFWWLLRSLGRDWFGRFMERYGMPFPVGKTNTQDRESVSLLQNAFSLATKVGGLVIGQDDQVELEQAAVQGGAEGHALWHRTCNDAISRLIVGYSHSDKPAGLNAGEDNQQANVREDIRLFDQRLLAETLEKQLFARFLKFNGLPGRVRVAWGGLNTDNARQFADQLKTMKDAGWEPTDQAIPAVQDKLGIEVRRVAGAGTSSTAETPRHSAAEPQPKKEETPLAGC